MRVTIFDYGAGNLHSLAKAIEGGGVDVRIEEDPTLAIETDALVLPGVGAFGAASGRLAPGREAMRDAIVGGLPTLGICLGMQLLFEGSDEGVGAGLGVMAGHVSRCRTALHRVLCEQLRLSADRCVARDCVERARGRSLCRCRTRGNGSRRPVPPREELDGRRALAARVPR